MRIYFLNVFSAPYYFLYYSTNNTVYVNVLDTEASYKHD